MRPLLPGTARLNVGIRVVLAGCLALAGTGCASREAATTIEVNDPFQPVNRVMYRVNDLGDRYLLRPIASGYKRAIPQLLRTGVRNVFANLLYPVTIANDFLQGKFRQSGHDGARFLLNSTVGLGGLFDPATRVGLMESDEDFDQTLGTWGVRQGPYLFIPLLGPRTLRHAFGTAVDAPLTPFVNAAEAGRGLATGAWALYVVDARSGLLEVDEQIYEAFDPYVFVRDAYLQNRVYRALDGNVPEDDSYLEEPETDAAGPDPAGGD